MQLSFIVRRWVLHIVMLFACVLAYASTDGFTINEHGEQVVFAPDNFTRPAVLPDDEDFHLFGWSGKSKYAVTDFYGVAFVRANGAYAGDFLDWGKLIPADQGEWRTLTADEWMYVLTERHKAADLRQVVEKDGQKGLAIWPDSAKAEDMSDISKAVFLPYQGYRDGVEIKDNGAAGYYWTASPDDSKKANYISINHNPQVASGTMDRYFGCSVRLVQSVCQVSVQISVNDAMMGTVIFKPQ